MSEKAFASKCVLPRTPDGRLATWSQLGGYPYYYIDGDGSVLCAECARKSDNDDELEQFRPVACGINLDDEQLYCDNCSCLIECAYPSEKETSDERVESSSVL